jgi:predicted ATPase
MLQTLTLLRDRIADPAAYPFSVPAIASLTHLRLTFRVTLFAGENGTGKSTLLEAIALGYGLSLEGGNRNFAFDADLPTGDTYPLARALRLGFQPARTGEGFFFRAETLFNFATRVDDMDLNGGYGGISLHQRSHGETFFTVLDHKFRRSGLFLLDEPEAALSPQRQLAFLVLIHDTLRDYKDAQFILSTHSPILLGYPGAQVLSFDGGHIHDIPFDQTDAWQIVRRFLNNRDSLLKTLLQDDPPTLCNED